MQDSDTTDRKRDRPVRALRRPASGHSLSARHKARMTRPLVLTLLAGFGLVATLLGVAQLWDELGVTMTLHGWIAYGLGAAASCGLAGGLFFLTFKSARDGFDDIDRPEDGID